MSLLQARLLSGVLALIVVCSLIGFGFPADQAYGEVRKTDVVVGTTVEDRGAVARLYPSVDAEYALLVDGRGIPYFERNVTSEVQIASITKVMTAILALEHGDLDAELTVSAEAASVGESSAELKEGDRLTLQEALKALMIPSGNDAAIAISQYIGSTLDPKTLLANTLAIKHFSDLGVDLNALAYSQNPMDVFVCAMNVKGYEIGLAHTAFANPHGLDYDQYAGTMYSTAGDVAVMCRYAMTNQDFRDIVATTEATITVTRADNSEQTLTLESTDELIGNYDGACGIKTGNTLLAGPSFAGACQRNGDYLYAIVLNSTSEEQRFVDAENLYNWYYDNHVSYTLAQSDQTVQMTKNGQTTEVPVVAEVSHSAWPDKTIKATFADPSQTVDVFSVEGNVSQKFDLHEITGNVHTGDILGTATFYQNNQEIAKADVIAAEDVDAPGFFEGLGIWWDRLLGGSGGNQAAESVIINQTPLIYDKTS